MRARALVGVFAFLIACRPEAPAPISVAPAEAAGTVEPAGTPMAGEAARAAVRSALGDRLVDGIDGPRLEVHFIDIGQGDAVLVRAPSGKTVLIDTGPPGAGDRLFAYLRALGVTRIDLLVNSHPHSDHIGNTSALLEQWPVGRVFDSGFAHPTSTYETLLTTIERKGVPFNVVRKGQKVTVEAGVTLEVLGPEEPLIEKSRSDANANSVVLRLDFGGMRFLLTGDAEEETEERLVKSPAGLAATVLKVAHHGSAYATKDAFLAAVSPRLAVISCAAQNTYGHPAASTLARLADKGVAALSTSTLGNVRVVTDGQKLAVDWAADGPPGGAVATPADEGKLDLNTATSEQLRALPGIGEVLAGRILAWRTAHGRFGSVDELKSVEGIGEATPTRLRPLVTVR